jgi:DNA processing protein
MDLLYQIATSFFSGYGFGPINTKKAIAYTGSLEALFKEKKQTIAKIPGIGSITVSRLNRENALREAEEELKFIEENHAKVLFYLDSNYPQKLKHYPDSPCTLYYKGNLNFNPQQSLSIIGTRNATPLGKENCTSLIEKLAEKEIQTTIVSGLAYGIDICAHKAAIKNNLPTIVILGHGLDRIYPAQHAKYISDIMYNGGIITEFTSKSKFDPKNFLKRNRIIAGISDATIVVESALKGGAMVTADIADSYNKDIFAFPGRTNDPQSKGCNHLIKNDKANLIEGIDDLDYVLGWQKVKPKEIQTKLFIELSPDEEKLTSILSDQEKLPIDIICMKSNFPMSKVSSLLLKLEFEGIILSHPGKIYSLKS